MKNSWMRRAFDSGWPAGSRRRCRWPTMLGSSASAHRACTHGWAPVWSLLWPPDAGG